MGSLYKIVKIPQAGLLSLWVLSLLLALIATSGQSLWIDEAYSAGKAMQPTLSGWWLEMNEHKGSDIQMPGYMIALWGWGKVFNTSEFGLRSLNILFFMGAQAAFCFCLRSSERQRFFVLLASMASPFLWCYLDEARPYVMQFCGASLMGIAVWNNAFFPRKESLSADLALFCLGSVILCASSLLGVIHTLFFGLMFLASLILGGHFGTILKQPVNWAIMGSTALVMGALGLYYAWTLVIGAKASAVGQTSMATLVFAAYELLGFGGLGPGRIELREVGPRVLLPYAGYLVLGTIPYLFAGLWLAIKRPVLPKPMRSRAAFIGFFLVVSFLVIAAAGFLGGFRVVGRHFMPLLPFLLIAFGLLWSRMWDSTWRWAVGLSLLVFLGSSLNQRFSSRFAKDDYQSASTFAKDARLNGKTVWWAADSAAANYYGVSPLAKSADSSSPKNSSAATSHSPLASPTVFLAINPSSDNLATLPVADAVILSKPDIYDSTGALRDWLKQKHLTVTKSFPAFTVWERINTRKSE